MTPDPLSGLPQDDRELAEQLVASGSIDPAQLPALIEEADAAGVPFAAVVARRGLAVDRRDAGVTPRPGATPYGAPPLGATPAPGRPGGTLPPGATPAPGRLMPGATPNPRAARGLQMTPAPRSIPPTTGAAPPPPAPAGRLTATSGRKWADGAKARAERSRGAFRAPTGGSLEHTRSIGRYVDLVELGRGGMGVVYRALDSGLQRFVAIKMIRGGFGDQHARMVERFVREARAVARLKHPHIVAVHEVGEEAGRPFIVMDFIEGETLDRLIRRDRIPPRQVARITRGIALALSHAHEEGIVHRDVKPHNVLIDWEGVAHLTDFGAARDLDSEMEEGALTMTGQLIGTPLYMSPEQARGARAETGPASDIYSLGALLYDCLVRRPPFEAQSLVELIPKLVDQEPDRPRSVDASVHPDLETIAMKCLEKEPRLRYAKAADVAEELRRWLDGEAITARPLGRGDRLRRWIARNRPLAGALLVAALLGVAGIGGAVVAARQAALNERDRLVGEARRSALTAWGQFEQARAAWAGNRVGSSAGAGHAARSGDAPLLADGLDALEAAGRWLTIDPESRVAREHRFKAAIGLGEAAVAQAQWSIAASAFEKATNLGVDDGAAAEALGSVGTARDAAVERRLAAVDAILEECRSGAMARRLDGYDDAVFRLVALGDADTVGRIATALLQVTAEARDATAELLRRAAEPSVDEARAGGTRIEGLEGALQRWRGLGPGDAVAPDDEALLARARQRLAMRLHRKRPPGSVDAGVFEARSYFASELERALGRPRLLLARLCCDALGRIAIRDAVAIGALGAYGFVEPDPIRAVPAGLALCRLGGPEALALLIEARSRFGRESAFWVQVRRRLGQLDLDSIPADDAEGWLGRGSLRLDARQLDAALTDLGLAIEAEPELAAAWEERGRTRLTMGDYAEAIDDLERAVALAPRAATAWRDLGLARIYERDLDRAIADLSRAIELEPRLGLAWSGRSSALIERGRYEEALEDASRAIALVPMLARSWANRSRARYESGDVEGALRDANRAVELDPGSARAFAQRGTVLGRLGDFEAAMRDLDRAVDLAPDRPFVWNGRGMTNAKRGNLEAAADDFRRSLAIDPKVVPVIHNLGNALRLMGETDAAFEQASLAIATDPEYAEGYTLRGMLHRSLGRLDAAIEDATRAIELKPHDASSWNNRGSARLAARDHAGAIADFTAAIERDPRFAVSYNNRAHALGELGRMDEAIADLTRAVEIDASYAQGWRNRAYAREAIGDLDGALEDLEAAIAADPNYISAWVTRGKLRIRRGEVEAGIADLTRAIEIDPRSGIALEQRARARVEIGDLAGAIADFRLVIEIAGDDPRVSELRRMVAELERRRAQEQ